MRAIERNKILKEKVKKYESLLKTIRRDLKALRNRLEDSTDIALFSMRIKMIDDVFLVEDDQ